MLPLATMHVQAWRETYPGIVPDSVLAALDPANRVARWRQRVEAGTVLLGLDADGIVGFADGGVQRDPSVPFAGGRWTRSTSCDGRSGAAWGGG